MFPELRDLAVVCSAFEQKSPLMVHALTDRSVPVSEREKPRLLAASGLGDCVCVFTAVKLLNDSWKTMYSSLECLHLGNAFFARVHILQVLILICWCCEFRITD